MKQPCVKNMGHVYKLLMVRVLERFYFVEEAKYD